MLPQDLITPKQAAHKVKRSLGAVYRWIQRGRLKAYRLAGQRMMISEADLEKVLQPVEPLKLPRKKHEAEAAARNGAADELRRRGYRF